MPGADFAAATVTMTQLGCPNNTPVATVIQNRSGQLIWVPTGMPAFSTDGWGTHPVPAADTVYHVQIDNVSVGGVAASFAYDVIVIDPAAALPAPTNWNGSTSSDWNQCSNWSNRRAPLSIDDVTIAPEPPNSPVVAAGAASARTLTLASGAGLALTGGTLSIYGHWQEQGAARTTAGFGRVVFRGRAAQTLQMSPGSTLPTTSIGDGATPSQVTLGSNVEFRGSLTIGPGANLDANTRTLRLSGDWHDQNPGYGFVPGTSTVIFGGAMQTATKTTISTPLPLQAFDQFSGCCTGAVPAGWSNPGFNYYQGPLGFSSPTANRWFDRLDAWLLGPAMVLQAGALYEVQYKVAAVGSSPIPDQNITGAYGTVQDRVAMTNIIAGPVAETTTTLQPRSYSFTPPASGTYYLGLRSQQKGGAFTAFDDISVSGSGLLAFYNLTLASGTTAFEEDVRVNGALVIDAGATASLGAKAMTVEGTVTNNGRLRQLRDVPASGTTELLRIRNAAGSADPYWGVSITPEAGGLGPTVVTIAGNQACGPTNSVKRCFTIAPTTPAVATIRFFSDTGEANGNFAPNVWRFTGAAWEMQTFVSRNTASNPSSVTAGRIGTYTPFALGDQAPNGRPPWSAAWLPLVSRGN
jgi:hypothetical protein